MEFIKMESCGNDYIILNNITKNVEKLKQNKKLIQNLTNRNFGIGSNGIIFLEESSKADYKIEIFNNDGTYAKTSGNALICIAKYLYENNYVKNNFTIETYRINQIKIDNKIMINLGKPSLNPKMIPVITDKNIFINEVINIKDNNYKVTCLSVGNPHAIFFDKFIDNIDLNNIGPYFGYHYKFPDKINVTLTEIIDEGKIKIRIFEHGIGETLGCGTASAATVVAYYYDNMIKKNEVIKVIQPGGIIEVIYTENDDILIKGDSKFVYEGKVFIKC